jgi:DNA-binding MarR family transcriptional regulator
MNASLGDEVDVRSSLTNDRSRQLERASRLLAARQERRKFFPGGIFGEPGWEMLLVLYVSEQQSQRLTVTTLCQNSGFPVTTALRWLHFLEADRLVSRTPSPVDRRIFYLDLTEKARSALDRLLLQAPFA